MEDVYGLNIQAGLGGGWTFQKKRFFIILQKHERTKAAVLIFVFVFFVDIN